MVILTLGCIRIKWDNTLTYIAVKTRSKQQATDFLNHFLPNHEESADEYEFPQYSKATEKGFGQNNMTINLHAILTITKFNGEELYQSLQTKLQRTQAFWS